MTEHELLPPSTGSGRVTAGVCGRLGGLLLALLLAPLAAAPAPASVLGLVISATGLPQSGAVIRVRALGHGTAPQRQVTGSAGTFSLAALLPGTYLVEVGDGTHVLAERRLVVHAHQHAVLTISLPNLLSTLRFAPPGSAWANQDEQFRWVLRSTANERPILRLIDPDSEAGPAGMRGMRGFVALSAGSGPQAFTSAGNLSTSFRLEKALAGDAALVFGGNVGMGTTGGSPDSSVEATYRPRAFGHHHSLVSVSGRQVASLAGLPDLRVISLNYADNTDLGDSIHIEYGAFLNAVSLLRTLRTVDPYARVQFRFSPHAGLEYRFATATPPLRFAGDHAEVADPTPRVTLVGFRPRLEHAQHHEVTYHDELTPNDLVEVTLFSDHFADTAVTGQLRPDTDLSGGYLLPDFFGESFTANGGAYGGPGLRLLYHRQLASEWRGSIGFAEGAVLTPGQRSVTGGPLASALSPARRYAVTLKLSGTTPWSHTHVTASYRHLSGSSVTALDPYDDSLGQSDSYANLMVRQPLPRFWLGKVEALAEFHNLLAQGYLPVLSGDGHTVVLLQSARAIRGGLSINF